MEKTKHTNSIWKRIIPLVMIIVLLIVLFTSTTRGYSINTINWSNDYYYFNNTFNNSLTTEVLNFTIPNQNITRYLRVPQYSWINNSYFSFDITLIASNANHAWSMVNSSLGFVDQIAYTHNITMKSQTINSTDCYKQKECTKMVNLISDNNNGNATYVTALTGIKNGTIAFWFKPQWSADNLYIFSRGITGGTTNQITTVNGTGGFTFVLANGATNIKPSRTITLNSWHLYVIAWNDTGTRYWIDNGTINVTTSSKIGLQGTYDFFGDYHSNANPAGNVSIENIQSYDYYINESEISNIYLNDYNPLDISSDVNFTINGTSFFANVSKVSLSSVFVNITNYLNDYLPKCQLIGAYCDIPINFNAKSSVNVTYNNIYVNNSYIGTPNTLYQSPNQTIKRIVIIESKYKITNATINLIPAQNQLGNITDRYVHPSGQIYKGNYTFNSSQVKDYIYWNTGYIRTDPEVHYPLSFDIAQYGCINTTSNQTMVYANASDNLVGGIVYRWYCHNQSEWKFIYSISISQASSPVLESESFITFKPIVPYVNVSINNTQIFYGNITKGTTNYLQNFGSNVETYKNNNCGATCDIPITFKTLWGSTLEATPLFEDWGFTENSLGYTSPAYSSSTKQFTLNMSYSNESFTNVVNLVFNGTKYLASTANTGSTRTYSKSISVPAPSITTNYSFYWEIAETNSTGTTKYFNSSAISNYTVIPVLFSQCNSTLNIPYLNFTFHNDSLGNQVIGATLDIDFVYWLDSQNANYTYSFTNASENRNYSFCFTPQNTNMTVSWVGTYDNAESQARTTSNDSLRLSNQTTVIDLKLLSTSGSGMYVTFLIQDSYQTRISNALVVASTSGGTIVESKYTDGSGLASMWLDTTQTYNLVISKSGYQTYSTSLVPSVSPVVYTLTATEPQFDLNKEDYIKNVSISISPTKDILDNNTQYDFIFTISGDNLDEYGFALWNKTAPLSSIVKDYESDGGIVSLTSSTASQEYIIMKWYYKTNGDYVNGTKTWIVVNPDGKDFSINNFFNRAKNYTSNSSDGILGVKQGTSSGDFTLAIIIFLITIFATGMVSYKYGITNSTAVVVVLFAIVMMFDVGVGILPRIVGIEHSISILLGIIVVGMFVKEMVEG